MNPNDLPASLAEDAELAAGGEAGRAPSLMHAKVPPAAFGVQGLHPEGIVVGELLALADNGATPLVRYEGQREPAALRARSVVDLHGAHIGASVVLMFERCDPLRPVVMGVLRGQPGWPLGKQPDHVDVDVDGSRMVISARERIVLRCGKASITLTKAGKVLVEGTYLLSRSTGVNRVKGGAVQLN